MQMPDQGSTDARCGDLEVESPATSKRGLTFLFALIFGGPIWLFTFVPVFGFGVAVSANWVEALPFYAVMVGPPAYLFIAMIYEFRKSGG